MKIDEILNLCPVLPVLTVDSVEDGVAAAEALVEGGLPVIEVTLRTPAAPDAAAAIVSKVAGAHVGLGTVLEMEHLTLARDVGATFALSPGLDERLIVEASRMAFPYLPGAATATEIILARRLGLRALKFLPVAVAGGPVALRFFASAFPDVKFCPGGGLTEDRLVEFLRLANVPCVSAAWFVEPGEQPRHARASITERARRAAGIAAAVVRAKGGSPS